MKKYVALLLAGMMALSLAACGSSSSTAAPAADDSKAETEAVEETAESTDETAPAEAAAADTAAAAETAAADTAFTTVEEGKLHMATNAAFPPYEMTSDDGGYEGIDVEVATMIAEKLGLELVVDDMEFSSVITSVQSGRSDIAMAGLTVNEERKQNINFTDSYATGVQVIIVTEDSDIATADDLANDKMIGCQQGTTGSIYCQDDYGEDHVTDYTNGAMAIEALKAGKVDAVVIDSEPAKQFVAVNEGLKILDTEYVVEEYAIGVSKENTALLNSINATLQELIADGTVQGVIDKYINAGE